MKDDFQLKFKNFVKRIAKHAKRAVSFRIKNNETWETGCFAKHKISRNCQLVSQNNETRFASIFAKQKAKRVSLETLLETSALLKNSIEISIRIYFSILYYLSKNDW
jgi:hypothetical protein